MAEIMYEIKQGKHVGVSWSYRKDGRGKSIESMAVKLVQKTGREKK